MKVLWTAAFEKNFKKKSTTVSRVDLLTLIKKFPNTNQLIILHQYSGQKILKGYLQGKRLRVLVLLQEVGGYFVPIVVVKKESSKGQNINKENYEQVFGVMIEKIQHDIQNDNFEIIELE
jgi:hypothetical protein